MATRVPIPASSTGSRIHISDSPTVSLTSLSNRVSGMQKSVHPKWVRMRP